MSSLVPLDQLMALNPNEIAAVTGFSRDLVMRAIHAGELNAGRKGNRFFATKEAVKEWLDAQPRA